VGVGSDDRGNGSDGGGGTGRLKRSEGQTRDGGNGSRDVPSCAHGMDPEIQHGTFVMVFFFSCHGFQAGSRLASPRRLGRCTVGERSGCISAAHPERVS